jgi:hypothetical protein
VVHLTALSVLMNLPSVVNLGMRFLEGGGESCNTLGVTIAPTIHLHFHYNVSTRVATV